MRLPNRNNPHRFTSYEIVTFWMTAAMLTSAGASLCQETLFGDNKQRIKSLQMLLTVVPAFTLMTTGYVLSGECCNYYRTLNPVITFTLSAGGSFIAAAAATQLKASILSPYPAYVSAGILLCCMGLYKLVTCRSDRPRYFALQQQADRNVGHGNPGEGAALADAPAP